MEYPETIMIENVKYARADSVSQSAPKKDGLQHCIVRTSSAGVFAGYVEQRVGKEATLHNARRLWKWDGAATLSQLATDGTSKPSGCKFPCEVDTLTLTEVIEIIPTTAKAKASIDGVKVWQS